MYSEPKFYCNTCLKIDYCIMCKSSFEHLHEDH